MDYLLFFSQHLSGVAPVKCKYRANFLKKRKKGRNPCVFKGSGLFAFKQCFGNYF